MGTTNNLACLAPPVQPQDPREVTLSNRELQPGIPSFTHTSLQKFTPSQFTMTKTLGFGSYGTVKLAIDKDSNRTVAIKEISKSSLKHPKHVTRAFNEKDILATIKHPLIVDVYGTCQDSRKLYLVMEYVSGGDLYSLLVRRKLTQSEARFYAAEIVDALFYLHSQGVVYRDLKPENVLLAATGHIKLADFGCAKRLKSGERTNSICGTPDYLAPETLNRKGHCYAVDWWAVGIFLHELLTGESPFRGDSPMDVYTRILTQPYVPPKNTDEYTKQLLRGLLHKNSTCRLTGDKVRSHPYFFGIDWKHLNRLQPPYLPTEKTETVTGNLTGRTEETEVGDVDDQEVFQEY